MFTWNSVSPDCQAVHYEINTINCGQCPNATSCHIGVMCPISTNTNSVSCGINFDALATLPVTCAIIIQPVICGNVSGNSSILNVNGNNGNSKNCFIGLYTMMLYKEISSLE